MSTQTRRTLGGLLAALGLAASALGQDAPPVAPATGGQAETPPHPGVVLGRRAGMTLGARGVIPTVVVVPDPASYAEAIAGWKPSAIYPVLIDDGSAAAREDIARFVRGFRPESVVRWEAGPDGPSAGGAMRERRAVPRARALTESALYRAWGYDPEVTGGEGAYGLVGYWVANRHLPPGVIIADERDPAWTAALALAAARGEPIAWLELPGMVVDAGLAPGEIDGLCEAVESACEATGLPWRGLGDLLDAVTVCAGLPARYETAPEEFGASTDRLGRLADGERWAWAGQVFGTEPRAAYRAMCSVFLGIESAWLFDGYGSGEPWGQWDCTGAAEVLKKADILTMVDDEPRNTPADWKLRAERPLHAGLVMVNSSGNRVWFELGGSKAWAGDIPLLEIPAAMHMVHSWSAASPARSATVGGKWLERGVFVYAGSVHEPYLQAFVPTPIVAQRLIGGMAFGAAVRVDGGGPWRVAVLGDPLFAYGPRPVRLEEPLGLADPVPLDGAFKAAAAEGRYAEMYTGLALLGRDADVARLFVAMLRDQPEKLNGEVATAALFALYRTGSDEVFLRAYAVLPAEVAGMDDAVDALWHVGRRAARERSAYREAALGLMAGHIREKQAEADAAELTQLGGGP
ncbi:MAG: hypothetical protein IT431_08595 [Phycisphaerales bacterium]|nr:hypothetical protein [Phycisphaerales bacterium]